MDRLTDAQLLEAFGERPSWAWQRFLDRYADLIFGQLQRIGFDYDEAMERFVYVCEKLTEDDFRRFRRIERLGDQGELTPWLRQVVKNLAINWLVSQDGKRVVFKAVAAMSDLDRLVFEGYFWRGESPSELCATLGRHGAGDVTLLDVLDSLDRLHGVLDANRRWRLLAGLLRRRPKLAIAGRELGGVPEDVLPAAGRTPEQDLLRGERRARLAGALATLPDALRLTIQLRYEDGLTIAQTARLLAISENEVRSRARAAKRELVKLLGAAGFSVGEEAG